MDQAAAPRILVAPLDWGLGHASRCIPLIRRLIYKNYRVFLAGNEKLSSFLQPEFPDLPWLPLKGYDIKYPDAGGSFALKMAAQLPKILSAIRQEHNWLKGQIDTLGIQAVISDNRYGLWNPAIPGIFITHQLRIQAGKLTEGLVQRLHYQYINRFDQCWIPDAPETGLAGALSHPKRLPAIPVQYLGTLSRFEYQSTQPVAGRVLALISGPEPQRTIFEDQIRPFLQSYPGEAVWLRGLPGERRDAVQTRLRVYNHLDSPALALELSQAEFVICRPGYSSLMDLERFQAKLLLVPTPGQTEQEYLAHHLAAQGRAVIADQKNLDLNALLKAAANANLKPLEHFGAQTRIDAAIDQLADLIKKH